jgi:hypothetical protein
VATEQLGAAPSASADLVRKTELDTKQAGPLTGDVTTSGAAATIANNSVTYAKMQDIATDSLIGRDTAATGDPETISLNATLSMTGAGALQRAALTGDVTASAGSNATTIANDAVTYAKMQNVSATSRVLGRITAGAGDPEELTATDIATILGINIGAWTAFTPTVTGISVGNGTLDCAYVQIGKMVTVRYKLTVGSTTTFPTAGTTNSFSLPFTAVAGMQAGFPSYYRDASLPGNFHGFITMGGSATSVAFALLNRAGATDAFNAIYDTAPFTWAVNDLLGGVVTYERT